LLWKNPQVLKELSALFDFLTTKISHLATSFEAISDVPISIHARYTRIEILAAFGRGNKAKTPTWREGVLWAEVARTAWTLSRQQTIPPALRLCAAPTSPFL
jgi:hypothetical protein